MNSSHGTISRNHHVCSCTTLSIRSKSAAFRRFDTIGRQIRLGALVIATSGWSWLSSLSRVPGLTPIDQQECKTYDFDGDETKTGSARMVVYVGAM